MLLYGAEGIGKTSLVAHAGAQLSQTQAGQVFRLDLAMHASFGSVAQSLREAAGLGGSMPQAPAQSGAELGDFVSTLDALLSRATRADGPTVIAFDNCHELQRLGGSRLVAELNQAFERRSAVAAVYLGSEYTLRSQQPDLFRALSQTCEPRKLEALEPHAFARWIDGRFAAANLVTRGVGSACVDLTGPHTDQTIELARQTFSLSCAARFGNEATVRTAFGQIVDQKHAHFAAVWGNLSSAEQRVLKVMAEAGGQNLLQPPAVQRCEMSSEMELRMAVSRLMGKRLIDPVGQSGLRLRSAAMKQWTVDARWSLSRTTSASQAEQMTTTRFQLRFQTKHTVTRGISPHG